MEWESPYLSDDEMSKRPADELADIAGILNEQADYEGALRYIDKALQIDPKCGRAYFERAWIKLDEEDYQGALEDYSKAIELGKDAVTLDNRGSVHLKIGNYDEAIADYTESICLDQNPPDLYTRYRSRAEAYAAKQEYELALADYMEAIHTAPLGWNWYIYAERAELYRRMGRIHEAEADEREAQQQEENMKRQWGSS